MRDRRERLRSAFHPPRPFWVAISRWENAQNCRIANRQVQGMLHVKWPFVHARTTDTNESMSVVDSEHNALGKVTWDFRPVCEFRRRETGSSHDGVTCNLIELWRLEMA